MTKAELIDAVAGAAGVSKAHAKVDWWLKEIAPCADLHKWFGHDPKRWAGFKTRYLKELAENKNLIDGLLEIAHRGRLTLVFSAKDEQHNNAVALKEYLRSVEQTSSASLPSRKEPSYV